MTTDHIAVPMAPVFKGVVVDVSELVDIDKIIVRTVQHTMDNFLAAYKQPPLTEDERSHLQPERSLFHSVSEIIASRKLDVTEGTWWRAASQDWTLDRHALLRKISGDIRSEIMEHVDEVRPVPACVELLRHLHSSGAVIGICSPSFDLPSNVMSSMFNFVQETCDVSRLLQKKGVDWSDSSATHDVLCHQALCAEMGVSTSDVVFLYGSRTAHIPVAMANFGLSVVVGDVESDTKRLFADVSLDTFEDATIGWLNQHFDEVRGPGTWRLTYKEYSAKHEPLRESLTCVGNGYMGSRGTFAGVGELEDVHYPGNYLAGVFNTLVSDVDGHKVTNSDLVNVPNWSLILIAIDGTTINPFDATQCRLCSYEHTIHLKDAVVHHYLVFEERETGRCTEIESKRVCSMRHFHQAAVSYNVTPLNYSATITLRSGIDGTVVNNHVARYRQLEKKHLVAVDSFPTDHGIFHLTRTNTTNITIGLFARHHLVCNKFHSVDTTERSVHVSENKEHIEESFTFLGTQACVVTLEKLVAIYTSHDLPPQLVGTDDQDREIQDLCTSELTNLHRYAEVSESNRRMWRDLWYRSDIVVHGDRFVQRMIRVHTYHLFVTMSPAAEHSNGRYGLTARGLSGESYRGHVFWDEVYMFPFYLSKYPTIAKAHLKYRIRLLPAAKQNAIVNGHRGAMIPWQVSDTGREETQVLHLNPLTGVWGKDESSRQYHVGIAVFMNGWRYYAETRDTGFLADGLAELMLEIGVFWESITTGPEERDGRYHIRGVMGPDEFHERFKDQPGLPDNAYTNVMVAWLFGKLRIILDALSSETRSALLRKTCVDDACLARMSDISRKMFVPMNEVGIIEQFDGYFTLSELDFTAYRRRYSNIRRIDRILKSEGRTPDLYQVSKQPDVLMIFYWLRLQEATALFRQLGYQIKGTALDWLGRNYDYYRSRCSHGSTLSYTVHARIAHMCGRPSGMWEWFMTAATSEIYDTQGTTGEGIHCAVMAGTLYLLITINSGLRNKHDHIRVVPTLPSHITQLRFNTRICNVMYEFCISQTSVRVTMLTGDEDVFEEGHLKVLPIKVRQVFVHLAPWQPAEVVYAPLNSIHTFLDKMRQTRHVRRRFAYNYFHRLTTTSATEFHMSIMKNILSWLRRVPRNSKGPALACDTTDTGSPQSSQTINVNLDYEITELERDICFMQTQRAAAEGGLYHMFRERCPDFDDHVAAGLAFLRAHTKQFELFVTDRDGTINNYNTTYQTCVQSAYNAVFVSAFARRCRRAIILTAAPLHGFSELNTNLRGLFILAGSKGREFSDETGTNFYAPIDAQEQELLEEINTSIQTLVQQPHNRKFSEIGSGLQFKYGSTTIARQDTCGSIKKLESETWLSTICDLCRDVAGERAVVHDTGLDIEVSIRNSDADAASGAFTKGDGLLLVASELNITLSKGPILVCGDTASDLAMLSAALSKCPEETYTIFVTESKALQEKVLALCPRPDRALFVPNADVLVTVLYQYADAIDQATPEEQEKNKANVIFREGVFSSTAHLRQYS